MAFSENPSPEENPFRKIKVRILILWGFLVSTILGFLLGISILSTGLNIQEPILTSILGILTISLLSILVLQRCRKSRISLKQLIGREPINYQWLPTVGLVIAVLIFSLGAFQLSYYPISFIAPPFVENLLNQKLLCYPSETTALLPCNLLRVLYIILVAPITEEFLFRGIILHRWATKWGIGAAILASSLFFGLLHRNFVGLFVFGVIMALLYIKTRTLVVPIMAHLLNNCAAVLLGVASTVFNSAETVRTLEEFRSQWWLGFLYLAVSVPWLVRFIYKNWPSNNRSLPYFTNISQ